MIDPNQVVGKGYENVQIETKDGRSLSGRLVEDTDSQIKLLSSGPKEDMVAKSDIASRRVSELSVHAGRPGADARRRFPKFDLLHFASASEADR